MSAVETIGVVVVLTVLALLACVSVIVDLGFRLPARIRRRPAEPDAATAPVAR